MRFRLFERVKRDQVVRRCQVPAAARVPSVARGLVGFSRNRWDDIETSGFFRTGGFEGPHFLRETETTPTALKILNRKAKCQMKRFGFGHPHIATSS